MMRQICTLRHTTRAKRMSDSVGSNQRSERGPRDRPPEAISFLWMEPLAFDNNCINRRILRKRKVTLQVSLLWHHLRRQEGGDSPHPAKGPARPLGTSC